MTELKHPFDGQVDNIMVVKELLTNEEVLSDYEYPEKGTTVRWSKQHHEDGTFKQCCHFFVDWNKREIWINGIKVFYDPKLKTVLPAQ